MQAVLQGNFAFYRAGDRDYMMRSEKRPAYHPAGGHRRPPKRAGFLYAALTLVLSLVLWPVGMLMLWRKRLRWYFSTKLLLSLISLLLGILLYAWLLNLPLEDPTLSKIQGKANTALDTVYDNTIRVMDNLLDRSDAWGEVAADLQNAAALRFANAISDGVEKTAPARKAVDAVWNAVLDRGAELLISVGLQTEPENSALPTQEPTPTPTVSPTPSATPSPTPEMPVVSDVPLTSEVPEDNQGLEIYIPVSTPDPGAATALHAGQTTPAPTMEATATAAPEWTAQPPVSAYTPTPKPTAAPAAPGHLPQGTGVQNAATQKPADSPAASQEIPFAAVGTPTPAPTVIVPTATLKPAGDAVVYHTSNGKYYHTGTTCTNMTGAKPYSLASSVSAGLRQCSRCQPPAADLIGQEVLWMDGDQLCHTSDECEYFSGKYSLILRQDAIAEAFQGCPHCFAQEYLIPNAILAQN